MSSLRPTPARGLPLHKASVAGPRERGSEGNYITENGLCQMNAPNKDILFSKNQIKPLYTDSHSNSYQLNSNTLGAKTVPLGA